MCRPFCVSSLTVCTRSCKPGSIAFNSDDLPTPLWPGDDALRAGEPLAQSLDAEAGRRRHEQHFVAELRVDADQRHQVGRFTRSILLMQMIGRMPRLLGRDQKAIDEIRLQPRLGGAGDDDQLVDVGHEHVLPPAAGAAQRRRAAARRAR